MIVFVVTLFAALVALGFAYPLLWVAAALLLFAFTRYGTLSGLRLRDDPGYREYRERRVRQDRYDRRYRREQARWGRRADGRLKEPAGSSDRNTGPQGKDKSQGAEGSEESKESKGQSRAEGGSRAR
ncbi:hypothetical protein AB0I22_02185 [Streptomyces sp. NPDC050610]|uniref:hypothetical protein n=1 Tax=Streptomyces sp. NPDC050610 TaxID=3157097 RepID=UPI003439D3D4